jgi:SpoVK/Ycf46/Vps4 family AAA+-type ATPase
MPKSKKNNMLKDICLKLIFPKSSSKYYKKVIDYSKRLKGYRQYDDLNEILLKNEEILNNYSTLDKIINIVSSWKNTEIFINDNIVTKSKFNDISYIITCSASREKSMLGDYFCYYKQPIKEGWKCKHLTYIRRYLSDYDAYDDFSKRPNQYWFSFGYFRDKSMWIIDKKKIKEIIELEVERNYIYLCKYFNMANIDKIIGNLPDKITIDENSAWTTYEIDVDDGYSIKKKAIGIIPKKLLEERNYRIGIMNYKIEIPKVSTNKENKTEKRNIPNTTFDDIGGLEEIVNTIREIIELPIKKPELFRTLGITPHKGILLFGPPGCGKTLIAKAIAREIDAHFIVINGPEILNKWYGQSEENLRNIFTEAKDLAPSIIFFDEIDSIATKRSEEEVNTHNNKIVNQLLTLMDGFDSYNDVKILASTNRPELIDEALTRSGRFDYKIEIKKPTLKGCKEILKIYTKNMPIDRAFDLNIFSENLLGLNGADIAFIVREAAYNCMRRNINMKELIMNNADIDYSELIISENDFMMALSRIKANDGNMDNMVL